MQVAFMLLFLLHPGFIMIFFMKGHIHRRVMLTSKLSAAAGERISAGRVYSPRG